MKLAAGMATAFLMSGSTLEASAPLVSNSPAIASCSLAIEAARQHCSLICGGRYSFSPGDCGVGATCICGGSRSPLPSPPPPKDP